MITILVVDELSGLRMLEYLNLRLSNIRGTIPSMLGRLSELRVLILGGNDLEGTIPPQLFNATNLEKLWLADNSLEGTIPETIGNLKKLSRLDLGTNKLSGSIPDVLYILKNLENLNLSGNKLTSSISSHIENLKELKELHLHHNMLTGQIPLTIGSLSLLNDLVLYNNRLSGSIPSTMGNMISLEWLWLFNNTLSGSTPESLFDLPYLKFIFLQDNRITGSISDEFCDISDVFADCRNDVFDPEVSCTCCTCTDESPIWDDECADATVKVVIDHDGGWSSRYMEWSLTNDATGKKVLYDGPYSFEYGLQSYEECVAQTDCFSFNLISPPFYNTRYYIYWNNEPIYNGTIPGWLNSDGINEDDPPETLLSFSYKEENQQLASCGEIKFICGEKEQPITLEPDTTNRFIYNYASKISGKEIVKGRFALIC